MPKRPVQKAAPLRAKPPAGLWHVLRSLRARGHHFRRRAPYKHFILDFVSFKDRIVIEVDRGREARGSAARDALLRREGFSVLRLRDDADRARIAAAIAETLRTQRQPRRVRARSAGGMVLTAPRGAKPNPAKLSPMAKRKASAPKAQRRPRGEIDRNYFFGDVLIKTGVAVFIALALIALYTPVTLMGAIRDGAYDYLGVMGVFAVLSLLLFVAGRHLRREATHWDFD